MKIKSFFLIAIFATTTVLAQQSDKQLLTNIRNYLVVKNLA
jgi:hypothetical protein